MSDFIIENGVLVQYVGESKTVKIPEGVTAIGEKAFDECHCLECVIIPEGIVSIGESAFEDCEHLTCVVLPDTLKEIGIKAFEDCKALETVVLPNGVRSLGKEAFADCDGLKGITLPYRAVKLPAAMQDCVEITAHNLAALYVFQRTKRAQGIFEAHAAEFCAEELANELLLALEGHETVRRCEKCAVFFKAHKDVLSEEICKKAQALFAKVSL